MALQLGDEAPDFTAESTEGELNFYDFLGDSWGVLFSHPADFTPVCTTELGAVAALKGEFDKRNTKVVGLSVDPLDKHEQWADDIEDVTGHRLNFPLISDQDRKVADLYGMIHPNASDTMTVRSVFVIGPDKKVKLTLTYPAATGRDFRERLDIRSALFVPIHSEDELIGSLLLYSTARRDRYSDGDIARAETVAEQAASAICNAHLYRDLERSESRTKALLERITRLREAQRLTVANVLHDDIVQTVVAALYQVEGLRAGGGETRAELERVASLLKQTIADARNVIWDLRPPVLDGLGLDGALAALANRISADGGFVVETDLADVPQLPPRISTALYVIAREALQNARRHARANTVTVLVQLLADGDRGAQRVCLTIADDGIGFDHEAVQAGEHFGLTMMDEQAALAGGTFTVTSRPGAGTTVEATVPFSGQG